MTNKKIWNISDLHSLNLIKEDVEYLSTQGIEVGNFGSIDVYPEFEFSKGVILGYDSDAPIVCFEKGKGVFSLEEDVERFVNVGVEAFALSIQRFKTYCKQVMRVDDEDEALRIVNSTINDMKKIDDIAWSSDYNYWPIIGQQMIEGNL